MWYRGQGSIFWVLALSASLWFSGCADSDPSLGAGACDTEDDCADDLICVDGLCVEVQVQPKPGTSLPPPEDDEFADYTESCGDGVECKPGLSCYNLPRVGRICTRLCPPESDGNECFDEDAEYPMECMSVRPDGGDLVSICVPHAIDYCEVCERRGDDITGICGTPGVDLCLRQDDGFRCAVDCSNGKECPEGGFCQSVMENGVAYEVCVPELGRCKDCLDLDGDGYGAPGSNSECVYEEDDCDDSDADVYPGASAICDGRDTSCAGRPDAEFTNADGIYDRVTNCGACGNDCYQDNVAVAQCALSDSGASCVIGACEDGFLDCDGDPSNGCETHISEEASCGACGVVCGGDSVSTTRSECVATSSDGLSYGCEVECAAGWSDCDGDPRNGCEVDLRGDLNCGACGVRCDEMFENGIGECSTTSQCELVACEPGWADCDGDPSNGCEADLSDPTSCGACGVACGEQNTQLAECRQEAGGGADDYACLTICQSGFADCNGLPNDGCEVNITNDSLNCGGCGLGCALANADTSCVPLGQGAGICQFDGCHDDFADCSNSMPNVGHTYSAINQLPGCGDYLVDNDLHCGSCGEDCTARAGEWSCMLDVCLADSCPPGTLDCDHSGLCLYSTSDPRTCGGCNNDCTAAANVDEVMCHPQAALPSDRCSIVACDDGFEDCDGNFSNGCEVNTDTSLAHCGGCGIACSLPNAQTSCAAGNCAFVSCNPGYMNLDGTEDVDGCPYQCTPTPGVDVPDDLTLSGYATQNRDSNCDGIDGDISVAIFVDHATGNDNNAGTMSTPLKTVNEALSRLRTSSSALHHIYVSKGDYNESLELVAGVSIFGGYDAAAGWTRNAGNVVRIAGAYKNSTNDVIAIRGSSIGMVSSRRTILQNISVESANATDARSGTYAGASSYAIHCADCSALSVIGVIARAGGGAAARLAAATQPMTPLTEAQLNACKGADGERQDHGTRPGGDGGPALFCAPGRGGGNGGASGRNGSGQTGVAGRVANQGGGSPGGGGAQRQRGGDGQPGAPGQNGDPGAGGSNAGVVDGDFWRGADGGAGAQGLNGHGGGGGGGGGGRTRTAASNRGGGSGGGGGAGGCGAHGGNGGGAGGASIAIALVRSQGAEVVRTTMRTVGGGDGSVGRSGADGLPGCSRGLGKEGYKDAGDGGHGGNGGAGGDGGSGGGGAGGPSLGLMTVGGQVVPVGPSYNLEPAGLGASGPTSAATGADGRRENVWHLP